MAASRALSGALRQHSAAGTFIRRWSLAAAGEISQALEQNAGLGHPLHHQRPRFMSKFARFNPREYKVHAWTDTPYLEYVVGLEPEGSTPATSTGGSTLAGVSSEKTRPHPGYTARLIRLRVENGSSFKAREAIMDEKSYMRDYGRFWIPLLADLLGGPYHFYSLEMFQFLHEHPKSMKTAKWQEMERIYSMMISYAGVVGDAMLARKWFDELEQKVRRKSSPCCNALIIAYAKDFDIESAVAIFSGMKHYHKECPPNAMTYYILISMFARYGRWAEMEQVLCECRSLNISLDMITITTLLHAYAKMGRRDIFERIYQEMQEMSFKPNGEVFTALLIGYSRLDALDRLQPTIAEMQEAQMQLTENIAVQATEEMAKAFSRNSSSEGLENLIQFVETTPGLTSTSAFQSYVVEAYAKSGKLEETEAYFKKVFERKADFVEAPALETVIEIFCKRELFERIHTLCRKAREAGFNLCSSTFELLISELAKAESYELMERAAADMEAAGIKWPANTLHVLFDAYEKSGNSVKRTVVSRRLKKLQAEEQEEASEEAAAAAAC